MKAIFCVPFQVGLGPVLPPMSDADDGLQLHYTVKGTLKGGYSCIGYVNDRKTCLVLVEASKATVNAMAASPDYLHMEDDGDAGPVAMKNTESWLLSQGHDAKELEKVDWKDKQGAVLGVHQVTDAEYADGLSVMAPLEAEPIPAPKKLGVI